MTICLYTVNVLIVLRIRPSQARHCMPDSSAPVAPSTSSSTPTRARTSRRRGNLARTGCTCHRPPRILAFPKLPPRPPRPKSSPAPPNTTRAQAAVPRHAHTYEALLRFPMEGSCNVASARLVSSAHFSAAGALASAYFLFALYCSAPPERFIFLQSWSWPPSFQCCTGIRAHSSACCSGRISCPR